MNQDDATLKMLKKLHKITKTDQLAFINAARRNLVQDLQELETRAHDLQLQVTARTLNRAKNAAGWEIAGNIIEAGKASRGELMGTKRRKNARQ